MDSLIKPNKKVKDIKEIGRVNLNLNAKNPMSLISKIRKTFHF